MNNLALWSQSMLTNRTILWLLFIVNGLGTIYGYYWYGDQLIDTYNHHPLWMIVFVPDSPTASLFFTIAVLYLLFPLKESAGRAARWVRAVIEALAVLTSIKYGIWAVAMIFAGWMKGGPVYWEHYMLIISHLAMAVEALLFTRFFTFGRMAATGAAAWLLLNDTMDYAYNIFPWLPQELNGILDAIRNFTVGLTIFSFLLALFALNLAKRR